MDPAKYVALGLTHVQYDATDKIAKVMALVTLCPIFLLCSYVTIIIYRRELTFINALVGQLGCEGVNWGLKRLIRQPRPYGHLGKGYGMPSSHSQFIGFFCAFFLSHFYLHHPKAARPSTVVNSMRRLEHFFAIVAIIALTFATCYSRYHLSYHTVLQIIVGLCFGLIIGFVYYYLTEFLPRQPLRLPARFGTSTNSPMSSPMSQPLSRGASSSSLRHRSRDSSGSLAKRVTETTPASHQTASSPPSTPTRQIQTHTRRRSSLSSLLIPELYPAPPIRQLILDHPLAVAFRLRDSWTVWLDGGIEGEYDAWRSEWEKRRKPYPSAQVHIPQKEHRKLNSIAETLDGFMLSGLTDGSGLEDRAGSIKSRRGERNGGTEGVAMSVASPSWSGSGEQRSQDRRFAADTRSSMACGLAEPFEEEEATSSTPISTSSGVPTTSAAIPLKLMKLALQQAAYCPRTDTAFCVGCIISISGTDRIISTGYSREIQGNTHAEQCALNKLTSSSSSRSLPANSVGQASSTLEDVEGVEGPTDVMELDLYTTMEPCSERLSGAIPCAQRILSFNLQCPFLSLSSDQNQDQGQSREETRRRKVRGRIVRIYQGVSEPEDFVKDNVGLNLLRSAGIEVLQVVDDRSSTSTSTAITARSSLSKDGRDNGAGAGAGTASGIANRGSIGWIEREALRLAKWGHADQPDEKDEESAMWKAERNAEEAEEEEEKEKEEEEENSG